MVEFLIDQLSENIVETIHEPLLVLDSDLKVILANRSFIDSFKVTREETLGSFIYDLGNRQWDIPRLRELLEKVLPKNNPFDNYEVEHDFTTIGRRTMLLNARQIEQAIGQERIILLAIEDITDRKETEFELSRYRQGLEKMLEEQTVDLKERVKEIGCLYAVSSLFAKPYKSIDDVLKSVVSVIPGGWQYPEFCRARIVFEGREFAAEDFRETTWKQSADIVLSGETVGTVEVCYLEEMPALDEGPFRKEERNLIDELARQLAGMVQRELDLVRLEHLNSVLQSLRNINQLIVHEKRRGPLIQTACKNLAHIRDLRGAWIVLTDGLPDRVEGTQTGFDDIAFSELLNLFQRGETPACFGHGQTESGVNVTNDPASACRNCPLADTYGGNSAVTIEVKHGNRRYGYMGIAVPIKFANDKEEASLFEEIAGDIAYALASIEQEEAVKEAEKRYRAIFEGAAEGILVADMEARRFRYCNPAICQMLGYSEEELIERDMTDIHPKESLDHVLAEFGAQARGDGLLAPSLPCLRKDGSVIYADVHTTLAVIDGLECNVGFFTDVTERRSMESQLRQAQKMEAIGALAGGIAHDFNNLLSVILGYSRLTMDELPKEGPASANLKTVVEAGERASELVKQILTFSRKQEEEEPQPVQIHLVVKEALKMLRSSIPAHVDIQQDIRSDGYVRMDVGRIHQVVMNLCTNAYQALTDTKGKIEVELSEHRMLPAEAEMFPELEPGDFIRLTVSDTGPGMAPEEVERIFEPYFTTKEIERGTGLGLSVAHGIVSQAGGGIAVYSKPGYGSRFDVFLPVWRGKPRIKHPTRSETARGSEHLIVVDDEEPILRLLRINLESLGYRVTTHTRAQEALDAIRQNPFDFDMVITDLAMPEMTGKELVQALVEVRPDLPIIACSGLEAGFDMQNSEKGGLRGVINKPFDKQVLSATVRNVLDEKPG